MIKINSQSFSLPSTVIPVAQKNNKDNNIITQQQQHYQQYHHGMRTSRQNGYTSPSYELSLRRSYSKEKMWQLHYVTERILSAVFPLNKQGTNDEDDLMEMFNQKYGKNYRIFDLESCFSKISLEKLCELCKQINLWLEISDKHIVVLQDRGSNQRLGAAVETYLEYTKICASTENRYLNSAVDVKDLDIYSMQKFLNDVTGPIIQPPFKRYIECFTALLSGQLKLNATPITISHVIMQFPPLLHQVYPYESEWKTFMQVYENEQCVFVSDIYVMPMKTKEIFYEIKSPLTLFGEIAINFYKIDQKPNKNILLSSLMFHSCSVNGDQIEFPKNDLLMAYSDNRFPKEHKVILLIDNALRSIRRKSESPARQQIGILRNYQNEFNHTQGPVNGSLYATVTRGQTSPQTTEKVLERVEVSRVTNSRLSDYNDTPRRNRNISSSEQDELDSLLSEMMLTVQNMPDVSKKNVRKENISPVNFNNYDQNEKYLFKNIENNKHNHVQPTQHIQSDDLMLFGYSKNKDQFENVSVSTVESSRNSPLMYDLQNRQKQYNNSNMFFYNSDSDTDTQSRGTKTVNNKRFNYQYEDDEHNIRENYIILQNSDQSYSHMQSNNNAKQNVDIPYHARKDSQPFTYGNINSSETTNMMRTTHSGLSSPSMVRKAASIRSDSSASTLTNRKIPTHEFDFEDMLHEHQEKKYSFGDKTPNREFKSIYNNNNNNNNKFEYGIKSNNNNNYRIKTTTTTSYEKNNRQDDLSSNSMDNNHSFDRSGYSSDGSYNGATWLQIQQQKLRSKKALQQNDFTDGEIIRRSRTLSPNGNYQTITTKTVTTSAKQPTTIRTKQVEYQYKPVRRDESYQVSRIDSDLSRPPTPAFPPPTPTRGYTNSPSLPPKSPTLQRREIHVLNRQADAFGTIDKWSSLQRSASSASNHSEPQAQEVDPNFVKFARDSSKYWYKPTLSRENAVRLLRNAPSGTFLVRDSTSFNAFGLVVKVPNYPPGSNNRTNSDELVRHFLIEPTVRGVRLKGCANEPVFSSLSALIYQHSITPLSLPCRLIIPDRDLENNETFSPLQKQLFEQGAACNVLYLYSAETESLTGPAAIRRTLAMLHEKRRLPKPIQVHFKVSQQGITLTDNTRQLFFRKHYPANTITYIGLDPDESRWSVQTQGEIPVINYRIFAFIAKKSPTSVDNQCHLFCELEDHQPATAIVSFGNKVLTGASKQVALNLSSQI